jgi:hypothetical protein
MHTQLTTTLSFPLNIVKLSSKRISRSPLSRLQRKFPSDMTLNSRRLALTMTTYIFWLAFLQNTVDQELWGCSKVSQQESYSRNFLCSNEISGEVSSGQTAFTSLRSASGEIGRRSNNMSQTRERQVTYRNSYDYSPKASLRSYPVGLPRG